MLFDWLRKQFGPLRRSPESQRRIDAETERLTLYHLPLCGYCIRVRKTLWRLSLNIELRNTQQRQWARELIEGGGRSQVPCLRIDHRDRIEWLYESEEIVRFLKQSYGD